MFKKLFRKLDLQLLADGGGAPAGGTSGAAGATGDTAAAAGQQTGDNLQAVIYGKQETAAAGQDDQAAINNEREARYKAAIKGEYKDLYDADVQNIVKQRLKATNEKVSKYDSLGPTLDLLARKYGVDVEDVEALNKAIEDDDTYFEDEALERGMSVQDLKELRKMERENKELKAQIDRQHTEEQVAEINRKWQEEARMTKEIYPNFDFEAESANDQFRQLLISGVDVRTAFEVCHRDEILQSGMRYAAKETERKLANNIAARGNRPAEGGMSNQSGVVVKSDVSKLTKADMREIERRVMRGERISFR